MLLISSFAPPGSISKQGGDGEQAAKSVDYTGCATLP